MSVMKNWLFIVHSLFYDETPSPSLDWKSLIRCYTELQFMCDFFWVGESSKPQKNLSFSWHILMNLCWSSHYLITQKCRFYWIGHIDPSTGLLYGSQGHNFNMMTISISWFKNRQFCQVKKLYKKWLHF